MSNVQLREGQVLDVITTESIVTKLGTQTKETRISLSYDQLQEFLEKKGVERRRPGSEGVRFSRLVSLTYNALKTGKWATGADIDRGEVYNKLMGAFGRLLEKDYRDITPRAQTTLLTLQKSKHLNTVQQQAVSVMADKIEAGKK